jgi:UDP:flavonoid glycosyltransferase YjiC (YdhE family)
MAGVTAPSHVHPSLGVIAELVKRGHDVTYVVGVRLADLVKKETGATVVAHPTILPDAVPAVQLSPATVAWEGYEQDLASSTTRSRPHRAARDTSKRCVSGSTGTA